MELWQYGLELSIMQIMKVNKKQSNINVDQMYDNKQTALLGGYNNNEDYSNIN